MLFGRRVAVENSQELLAEKIKNDLILVLGRRGIKIIKLDMDMETGNLNIELDLNSRKSGAAL